MEDRSKTLNAYLQAFGHLRDHEFSISEIVNQNPYGRLSDDTLRVLETTLGIFSSSHDGVDPVVLVDLATLRIKMLGHLLEEVDFADERLHSQLSNIIVGYVDFVGSVLARHFTDSDQANHKAQEFLGAQEHLLKQIFPSVEGLQAYLAHTKATPIEQFAGTLLADELSKLWPTPRPTQAANDAYFEELAALLSLIPEDAPAIWEAFENRIAQTKLAAEFGHDQYGDRPHLRVLLRMGAQFKSVAHVVSAEDAADFFVKRVASVVTEQNAHDSVMTMVEIIEALKDVDSPKQTLESLKPNGGDRSYSVRLASRQVSQFLDAIEGLEGTRAAELTQNVLTRLNILQKTMQAKSAPQR